MAVVVVVASLMLISLLIVESSRAAFTATSQSVGNSFSSGDVALDDDDADTARFVISSMEPGESVTRCITVTYNGSVDPQAVRLYSGGYLDSGSFGDFLNVTVDEGNGGSFAACTGFVADDVGAEFDDTLTQFDTRTDYSTGFGDWDPTTAGDSKTYQITVELDPATPNAQQNQSATALTFTWEVQS